jgi:hypothetical protein
VAEHRIFTKSVENRTGWWWLEPWTFIYFYDFPFSWEWNNHPNWRTHFFQRAWSTTNQRDLNRGNDDKASNLWRYPLFKQTKNCCLELLVSCGKSLLLRWCGEKGVFVISLPQWTESTIFFGFCLSWFFSGFKIQWTQFNWVSKFRVPKNVMIGNHIRLGKGLKQKRLKKL